MFCCIQSTDAERIAALFSPAFELASADTALFDAAALGRLMGAPDEVGRQVYAAALGAANVAMAANPDAAILAARNFPGVTILNDDAGTALADLPVDTLPLPTELLDLLDLWGVRTLGALASLPEEGVAERLGEQAITLHRLARATLARPLRLHQPDTVYEDRIELDHPVELLEPLLFLIARILNEQCAQLVSHGLAASEVAVSLSDYRRSIHLPVPMRDPKALLKLVQMELEAHPPDAPATAVAVSLTPVPPRRVQNGLFIPEAPEPAKLELTLGRIRGLVGEENVGIPELLDTHRPAPFRLSPRTPPQQSTHETSAPGQLAFRWFRPALAANVEVRENRPVRLTAAGIYGKILEASGPWRTSGDWWTSDPWDRDEWDVALNNGALYRLFQHREGSWHVEGAYD
ncbi:MAG TPA: hypothetical protein VFA04_19095 [Bryobacteraceae bacterium]|nr:hypothetical protein [Bryobacteraceae bacterium]